ncbi:hypothetical protein, partial [Streptomyces microflavus]|uniref:hypothetical protein n=1 Tax=Streptomyces microflavus TaxID=1919 RepID=UPI00339F54BB
GRRRRVLRPGLDGRLVLDLDGRVLVDGRPVRPRHSCSARPIVPRLPRVGGSPRPVAPRARRRG